MSVVCSSPCDSLVMTHSSLPTAERPPPQLPPSSPASARVPAREPARATTPPQRPPSPAPARVPARVPAPAPNITSAPERSHAAARAVGESERKQRTLADIVREGEWKKPEKNDGLFIKKEN